MRIISGDVFRRALSHAPLRSAVTRAAGARWRSLARVLLATETRVARVRRTLVTRTIRHDTTEIACDFRLQGRTQRGYEAIYAPGK